MGLSPYQGRGKPYPYRFFMNNETVARPIGAPTRFSFVGATARITRLAGGHSGVAALCREGEHCARAPLYCRESRIPRSGVATGDDEYHSDIFDCPSQLCKGNNVRSATVRACPAMIGIPVRWAGMLP